jgi:DNA-binding transcriptional ArsR family regulator
VDATTFAALADPNRLQIVEVLRDGPASVGEIAERLLLRQPQTSKHLKTLAEAGLVGVRPVAQRRVYELRPEPFERLDQWVALYRPTLDERLALPARTAHEPANPRQASYEGDPR